MGEMAAGSAEIDSADGFFNFTIGHSAISYRRTGDSIGITLLQTFDHFGQGHARAAMMAFLNLCDRDGLDVYLTPVATEKRVSKARLRAFYASLGFQRNLQREECFWATAEPAGHYSMSRASVCVESLDIHEEQERESPPRP